MSRMIYLVFRCLIYISFFTKDFNAILLPQEHMSGNFISYVAKSRTFNDFVTRNNLLYLGFVGPDYTWCKA